MCEHWWDEREAQPQQQEKPERTPHNQPDPVPA
jgi:hypothetical protein